MSIGRASTARRNGYFESVATGRLDDLLDRARTGDIPARGEIVVVVRGCVTGAADGDMTDSILRAMLDEGVTVRQTAAATARVTGRPRNVLYRRALELAAARDRE